MPRLDFIAETRTLITLLDDVVERMFQTIENGGWRNVHNYPSHDARAREHADARCRLLDAYRAIGNHLFACHHIVDEEKLLTRTLAHADWPSDLNALSAIIKGDLAELLRGDSTARSVHCHAHDLVDFCKEYVKPLESCCDKLRLAMADFEKKAVEKSDSVNFQRFQFEHDYMQTHSDYSPAKHAKQMRHAYMEKYPTDKPVGKKDFENARRMSRDKGWQSP